MTAPFVWIFLPAIVAVVLYTIRRWEKVIHFAGVVTVLLLAYLAWQLPIDQPIVLGIPGVPALRLLENFPILGQEFLITAASQPALILIYLGMSMWFGGAFIAGVDRLFIPLGLAVAALLTASITIQPKTFSILLVEIVALLCIPILSPPGKPLRSGVLRFLIFQTMGMILILLADWMLKNIVFNPDSAISLSGAALILGLGFALIAAIFPFHTWIPMLAEEAHPYSAAFVFFILPTSLSFLGLNYLSTYIGLGSSAFIYNSIALAGLLMVIAGGIWALFERHLGRILGFAAITQIGMGLLAISLTGVVPKNSAIAGIFFAQLFPQLIGFAVWALALSAFAQKSPDMRFRAVQGMAHQQPIATIGLAAASFSLAGSPLLASFPGFVALWSNLARTSTPYAIGSVLGCALLFASSLRTVAVLVMSPEQTQWEFREKGLKPILLVTGTILLFVLGVVPQIYMGMLTNLASIFIYQGP